MKFNQIDSDLLNTIASITEVPKGAVNIRKDGQPLIRMSSPNIIIKPKEDKPGIDVIVKPGTKNESVWSQQAVINRSPPQSGTNFGFPPL
jgi:hypothetical protein